MKARWSTTDYLTRNRSRPAVNWPHQPLDGGGGAKGTRSRSGKLLNHLRSVDEPLGNSLLSRVSPTLLHGRGGCLRRILSFPPASPCR
jgi:hypothetical protein